MTRLLQSSPAGRGVLYVEVKLEDSAISGLKVESTIKEEVQRWIRETHRTLKVGQQVHFVWTAVEQTSVTGYSRSRNFPDDTEYVVAENELDIIVYNLLADNENEADLSACDEDDDNIRSPFDITALPNRALDGMWESLVYADPVGELTLRALSRAIQERQDCHAAWKMSPWQNTVLFHGPPGSGKTCLAQALAQRLSIRLSNIFPVSKLLQMNSHVLFDKHFGETSKKIGRMFESIKGMASGPCQLVVVVFDEVETVASSREKATQKNEPMDSLRATNEVIRGLDGLGRFSNVVFIFTTNLTNTLDSAFLDRCYLKKSVNAPVTECVYEILRLEVNVLIQRGIVSVGTMIYGGLAPNDANTCEGETRPLEHPSLLPSLRWANMHWPAQISTAVSELHRIAKLAKNMSSRKLKGLLALARYQYLVNVPGNLQELLFALESVVREELVQMGVEVEERSPVGAGNAEEHRREDMQRFLMQLEAERDDESMGDE